MTCRVAVVEDDPDLLAYLRLALKTTACHIIDTWATGPAATANADQWRGIEVAVIDFMLGGLLDGLDVAEWIRAQVPGGDFIGIIILTATPHTVIADSRTGRLDIDRVLGKPILADDLAEHIRAVSGHTHGPDDV